MTIKKIVVRSKEADQEEAPQLHAMVKELASRANFPMPGVYIIPGQAPNAFATGRPWTC